MNAIALCAAGTPTHSETSAYADHYYDPLDPDEVGDPWIVTSRRRLTRLALVASEAGARFQREAGDVSTHDPMAWMLSPRELFGDVPALEACLERDHCLRAVLLHGLGLGLDAPPGKIDALIADSDADDEPRDRGSGDERDARFEGPPGSRRVRLYSATIVIARGGELLHAFHASFAPSSAVIRERIRARLGSAAAAQATIRVGFDPNCPTTLGMIPPQILDTLDLARRRDRPANLTGLDITVEERLPS